MYVNNGFNPRPKPEKKKKKKQTWIKPRSEKMKGIKKQEYELFKTIWGERPHFSEISGEPLGEFEVSYFSHILTKAAFPSLRLDQWNIVLCTVEEHHDWEFGDRRDPKWNWKKELGEFLKTKYKKR